MNHGKKLGGEAGRIEEEEGIELKQRNARKQASVQNIRDKRYPFPKANLTDMVQVGMHCDKEGYIAFSFTHPLHKKGMLVDDGGGSFCT